MTSSSGRWAVALSFLAVFTAALACGGGDATSPSLATGVVDTARIKLNYMCGNTFRARNYNDASVAVTWEMEGGSERGALVLPPKPPGAGFSATLFSTQAVGAVRLLHDGHVLQRKANEGGPECAAVSVGLQPPDSVPRWFSDDTSFASPGNYLKQVVWVAFREGATVAERADAISMVGGELVGGLPGHGGEGFYYVRIPAAVGESELEAAKQQLEALPQVDAAELYYRGGSPLFLRPADGLGFGKLDWSVHSSGGSGQNWALEAISAPMAWGCTVGGLDARIAVLDHRFESTEIASNVGGGAQALGLFPSNSSHGTAVASVLAARGNDSVGMTGLLWQASLQLRDFGSDTVPWTKMAGLIDSLARNGTDIINLSFGKSWPAGDRPDSAEVLRGLRPFTTRLRALATHGLLPLIVVPAGNDGLLDAWWGVLPALRDSFPENVVVVGGSDRNGNRWFNSSTGRLIDVFAPAEDVAIVIGGASSPSGTLGYGQGTSFAAPYVTAIAGMLRSQDPSLSPSALKSFIVAGAANRAHLIAIGAASGTAPLVDAYESLRVAAQRVGTPLCGNRVYAENKEIVASRGTGREVLASFPVEIAFLQPHHGGRRVDFFEDGVGTKSLVFGNGLWRATTADSLPAGMTSGTWNSMNSRTHDADSVLRVLGPGGTAGYNVTLGTSSSIGRSLGNVSFSLLQPTLEWMGRGAHYDTTGAFTGDYFLRNEAPASDYERLIGSAAAYAPLGDQVFVAISRAYHSFGGLTGWEPCPDAEFRGGVWDCESRFAQYQILPGRTDVYTLPTAGGSPRIAWSVAGRRIHWLGVSESGTEYVLATSIQSAATGQPIQTTDCRIEYRDFAAPGDVTLSVANPIACMAFGTGGIAPRRGQISGTSFPPRPRGG